MFLGVHVPVHDAQQPALAVPFLVGVGQAAANAGDNKCRQGNGDLLFRLDVFDDKVFEVFAVHEFHYHVVLSANDTQMVGLDYIGMDQVRHEPRLTDKVAAEFGDGRVLLANQLDGDLLAKVVRAQLPRFDDHAHAALRNGTNHLVMGFAKNMFQLMHRPSI